MEVFLGITIACSITFVILYAYKTYGDFEKIEIEKIKEIELEMTDLQYLDLLVMWASYRSSAIFECNRYGDWVYVNPLIKQAYFIRSKKNSIEYKNNLINEWGTWHKQN